MYDPRVGVWLNLDPIGFKAGDANPNRYVGNGPTSATDPSGLDAYFAFPKAVWESGLTVARYDGTDQQDRGMLFNPASGRREPIIEEYGKAFESFAKDHSNEPIDIRKYIKGADKGKQALINILDEVTNHGKDKIDQLWLVDHGRGDGNPERNDDGGGGQQLGDYVLKKEDFASLRPYLASHATIYLIGCNQGNFPLYCQDAATDSAARVVGATGILTNTQNEDELGVTLDRVWVSEWDGFKQELTGHWEEMGQSAGWVMYSPGGGKSVRVRLPESRNPRDVVDGGDFWDAFWRYFRREP